MSDKLLKPNSKEALEQLERETANVLAPLGYEVVALERSTAGGAKVTLYIDFASNSDQSRRISLDDCITVNRAVDELFETTQLLDGHYTLDVSSPGVERPLRKPEDFDRFAGKKVRIHTFRPLDRDEANNAPYWEKNKKQKNFVGQLKGLAREQQSAAVMIDVDGQPVSIPLGLVTKAHLEFVEE